MLRFYPVMAKWNEWTLKAGHGQPGLVTNWTRPPYFRSSPNNWTPTLHLPQTLRCVTFIWFLWPPPSFFLFITPMLCAPPHMWSYSSIYWGFHCNLYKTKKKKILQSRQWDEKNQKQTERIKCKWLLRQTIHLDPLVSLCVWQTIHLDPPVSLCVWQTIHLDPLVSLCVFFLRSCTEGGTLCSYCPLRTALSSFCFLASVNHVLHSINQSVNQSVNKSMLKALTVRPSGVVYLPTNSPSAFSGESGEEKTTDSRYVCLNL